MVRIGVETFEHLLAATADEESELVPCGYCQHCGYGGTRGEGSPHCLHKQLPSS